VKGDFLIFVGISMLAGAVGALYAFFFLGG